MDTSDKHFFRGAEVLTRAMMRLADARLKPRTCYSDVEDEPKDLAPAKKHIRKSVIIIENELNRMRKNKRAKAIFKKHLGRKPTDQELALIIFLMIGNAIQDDLVYGNFSVSHLVRALPWDKTSDDVSVLSYFQLFCKNSDLRTKNIIYITNIRKNSVNLASCHVVLSEHVFRDLLGLDQDKEVHLLEFTAENDLVMIR